MSVTQQQHYLPRVSHLNQPHCTLDDHRAAFPLIRPSPPSAAPPSLTPLPPVASLIQRPATKEAMPSPQRRQLRNRNGGSVPAHILLRSVSRPSHHCPWRSAQRVTTRRSFAFTVKIHRCHLAAEGSNFRTRFAAFCTHPQRSPVCILTFGGTGRLLLFVILLDPFFIFSAF